MNKLVEQFRLEQRNTEIIYLCSGDECEKKRSSLEKDKKLKLLAKSYDKKNVISYLKNIISVFLDK